jgi:hypothetical protein
MSRTTSLFAALFAAGVLTLAASSDARELREPQAHMTVDVPDDWTVDVDGRYQRATPPDHSFHLRIVASDHGMRGEQDSEQFMMSMLQEKMSNIQVTRHANRNDWGAYHGIELWGNGIEESGAPGKFFIMHLTDARDDRRGLVIIGTGTTEGFDRNYRGVYNAAHAIRVW